MFCIFVRIASQWYVRKTLFYSCFLIEHSGVILTNIQNICCLKFNARLLHNFSSIVSSWAKCLWHSNCHCNEFCCRIECWYKEGWLYNVQTIELQHEKTYLLMCVQRRLKSACTSTQSDQVFLICMKKLASLAIQNAPSKDSDQTVWMPRLIWIFAGHICPTLGFLTLHITKTRLFKYTDNFTIKNWKFSDKKNWYFSYFC